MKKFLLIFWMMMVCILSFNPGLISQTVDGGGFDPEEWFPNYRHITPELPDYYPPASPLTAEEMHVLDTLSNEERQIIEEAVEPPAVGVIRDLRMPVQFDLSNVEIPTTGEISTSGGRLSRISEDYLAFTTFFKSDKADEIRIFFEEGNFPHGVEVNLFSEKDYAFNQYDLRGTLDEYGFYTTTTFSDHLTMQILIPINVITENLQFVISKVIHVDNRYLPEETYRDCFLDANCGTANSYAHIESIREATARLYFPTENRYGLCTGGQLNDIRTKDWQPFLLTANHCFDTQASAAGLEARFSYWSTYCNSGVVNPDHIIFNGANLLATNSDTDVTLVLLKQYTGTYYLGWDAGSVPNNTTMHSVHHPGGTLMKYQRMTNKTSPSFSCGGFSTSDFYYTKTTHGQEEPGSSGGSIVDPDGRVRGQLYGWCYLAGADRCDYDTYYNMWGRFDKSYSDNNFGYWLYNGGSSVAMSTYPGSSLNFGTVNVGSGQSYNVTVYNTGTRPNYLNLEAGTASITGTNAANFNIIGTTFLYLPPGESGTFTVQFSPTSSGKKTATLNIPHNADNISSPKTITLTGYGNPCSDIISMNGGGSSNVKTFSKSGEGAWLTTACGFNCNGNEQIYSYVAPVTGTYRIEVTSTNNMWVDYFWKSGSCSSGGWNCINDVYSPGTHGSMYWTAGTTYLIMLDAESTSLSTHSFFVYPDPCANTITISGTGSGYSKTYVGGGYGSWYTSSASPCGYWCGGLEQVYSFTPSQTGYYSIEVTSASSWVDYMWKSGTCSSEDWICIDDIYSPGQYGSLFWEAGNTYLLLLDDEDHTASNHTFYIKLTEAIGTWTGAVSSNWHTPGNWTGNIIPDETIDVTIPSGTPYAPYIQSNDALCKNLTIESGATLTIGAYDLEADGSVNIHGTLNQNNTASKLYVYGSIFWHPGSSASATGSATIYVEEIWEFMNGAEVFLNSGYVDFFGSSPGYVRSKDDDSHFNHIRNNKSGSELGHSLQSTYPWRMEGNLYIYSNCELTSYTNHSIIIGNYVNNMSGAIHLDNGTFVFDGFSGTSNFQPGDYFNNLTISSTGIIFFDDDIAINGSLLIESGALNPGSTAITISGDWTNNVGLAGFVESTGRVIFNGPGHQYIYGDEHFNILEVDIGAALRVNNSDYDVSCNVYDWTAGGIDIVAGNFTALDLADSGLFGTYWCNPGGTLTLTQDAGQYTDLNGEIHMFGGTMNVNGGNGSSYWPYADDALISMSDGVLDFATPGIYLYGASTYTLTTDITGGTIRTSGSFYGTSDEFMPTGGIVEMYGPTDASVGVNGGSYFHDLNIDKASKGSQASVPANLTIKTDPERPPEPLLDGSKANGALAFSNFNVEGNLTIESGTFDINAFQVTVNGDVYIYGTLAMTDPSGDLTAGFIEWHSGSEDNVTAGTFHASDWRFNEGTNAMIGAGNTAYLKNLFYSLDDNAEFGNLVAQPLSKLLMNPGSRAYYPTRVTGDFTIQSGAAWAFIQENAGMLVNGDALIEEGASLSFLTNEFVVDGNITIAGSLSLSSEAVATVHGEITWPETGEVFINTIAELIFDAPNHPDKGWEYINGHLTLSSGLFEITHNSVNFGSTASTNVSGGTIKTGGAFRAVDPHVFEPTGGDVEITGILPDGAIYCYNDNHFYNLVINREPGNYCMLSGGGAVTVKNDLTILSGSLNSGNSTLFVGGNWTNNVGPDGFVENENVVWFYGETYSNIFTDETFYDLYIFDMLTDSKPANGQRFVEETYIADNVIVHTTRDCLLLGGSLNMGTNSVLDVDSSLVFNGGQLIVPDGTVAEIFVGADYGNYNPAQSFFPGQSTITFDGIADQNITSDASTEYYNNLVIDNPGNFVRFDVNTHIYGDVHAINGTFVNVGLSHTNTFEGDITVDPDGAFLPKGIINFEGNENTVFNDQSTITSYLGGDVSVDKSAGNLSLLIEDDMIILNGYSIDVLTGIVDLNGNTLRCTKNVTIHDGGKLIVDAGAELEVGDDDYLTVQSGGVLEVIGLPGNPATVTAWNSPLGHRYFCDIESGGTISASYGLFKYMQVPFGIHVHEGAIIDPDNSFDYCEFIYGQTGSGSSFLSINNDQEITITGASFPQSSCDYNVGKDNNQGHVTFLDYEGAFSGEDFDWDPYNLVDWYEPTLEADPVVLEVGSEAGSATFDVISNLDWTAAESTGWFSIAPSFGTGNATITVNYDENISVIPRSGEITLSAPEVPDVIVTVNQAGADPELAVIPSVRNVSAPAGSTTFTITSNTTWSVSESVTWFSVIPMTGSNNGTLFVTYDENTSTSGRSGNITVSGTGVPDVVVTVNQAGTSASLAVNPANRDVSADAGNTTFDVVSNTGWSVAESSPWLSAVPATGSGDGTITAYYNQNLSGSVRIAEITVTADGGSPEVTVTVSQDPYQTHSISLNEGWQGLSSYIMPVENDIEDVFAPVLSELILAAKMDGSIFYTGTPAVNTINTWDSQSAYKLKMAGSSTLPVMGEAEANKNYTLSDGWNIVPVICNVPVDAQTLFGGTNLQILKDIAGLGVYWPEIGVNTIGDMQPGLAYLARLSTPAWIIFPPNTDAGWSGHKQEVVFPNHPWNHIAISPTSHLIGINLQNQDLVNTGDVIGAFSGDLCCGAVEMDEADQYLVISAFADDPDTDTKTGFESGELMHFRIFNRETQEVMLMDPEFDNRQPNTNIFATEGISVITDFKLSSLGLNQMLAASVSLFPNPTDGSVKISGIKAFNKLEVFSSAGNILKSIETNFIAEINLDLSFLPQGMYQIKLSGNDGVVVKKLIIK